jgi:hypothetical protein
MPEKGDPGMNRLHKYSTSLLVVQVVALVCIFGVEITGRILRFDYDFKAMALARTPIYYRQPLQWAGEAFYRRPGPDRWRGQVLRSGLIQSGYIDDGTYEAEPVRTIEYDQDGFRNPSGTGDWHIAVVGDSFTELGYLDYEQLFTTIAAHSIGRKVRNLGVSYTGTLAHSFYLRKFGNARSTTDAVLAFFEGNDIQDIVREHGGLLEWEVKHRNNDPGNATLLTDSLPAQSSFIRALYRLALRRPTRLPAFNAFYKHGGVLEPVQVVNTPPGSEELNLAQRYLVKGALLHWRDTARTLNLRPWLLYLPAKRRVLHAHLSFPQDADPTVSSWTPTDLPGWIRGLCEENGIRFIDPTGALIDAANAGTSPYNLVFDLHLNQEGSEIVGRVLAQALSGQSNEEPAPDRHR